MSQVLSRPNGFDFSARLRRLVGLPLRSETAWALLESQGQDGLVDPEPLVRGRRMAAGELDPGWQAARAASGGDDAPLAIVARSPWWRRGGVEADEALDWLWKTSTAISLAAGKLARDWGLSEGEARAGAAAGLLVPLGLWAAASIDPDWLVDWRAVKAGAERREFERRTLGVEASMLGRRLAERWNLDPIIADATWLVEHRSIDSARVRGDARALELLRAAAQLAARTPWCLDPAHLHPGFVDAEEEARVKLLTAEVQVRCAGRFAGDAPSPREERLGRQNARLLLELRSLTTRVAASDGLIRALGDSGHSDSPEGWAERAGQAWCAVPGVSSARVDWGTATPVVLPRSSRAPDLEWALGGSSEAAAVLRVWCVPGSTLALETLRPVLSAWSAWSRMVATRASAEDRLEAVVDALSRERETELGHIGRLHLESLAEFAAGAGHELNNPLAVVVGRAQLLLARETDAQKARSLRAILGQAQRAHRILRDLMYVARPPQPRPRYCQPDEIWRNCLRDASDEAADRGVRLLADSLEHGKPAWTDPDGLRHLAEILLRNALEATPHGGEVRVATSGHELSVTWTIQDSGRGLTRSEGEHLFDPFFCGRQAGRGLGLGLPRASRFLELLGGEIQWDSRPGEGTVFTVRIPLSHPPRPRPIEPSHADLAIGSRGQPA